MTATVSLALLPRDGFFCNDGRGWHTSSAGRAHALEWPWPTTIRGALTTAIGRSPGEGRAAPNKPGDWRRLHESVSLGPTLALRRGFRETWEARHRVWPAPADALRIEGGANFIALDPRPNHLSTLGRDDDSARESLWMPFVEDNRKPLTPPRWWKEEDFTSWLAGNPVACPTKNAPWPSPDRRMQCHAGINPETLTADEGILFSHEVIETLETKAEWAVGLQANVPNGSTPTLATLGSDGLISRVELIPASLFNAPTALLESLRGGIRHLRLIAVTPCYFTNGWLPDGFSANGRNEYRGTLPNVKGEVILRSALVPRPLHVSGWDRADNEPKPTSRLVPPGAVYFFERVDGAPFTADDVKNLWLAEIGGKTEDGFGRVVPGVWRPNLAGGNHP